MIQSHQAGRSVCELDLQSTDDLLSVLHALGKNKKKADDTWILQAALDQCATTPACIANEFTKPQLSTHIIDKFCSYAWLGGHR